MTKTEKTEWTKTFEKYFRAAWGSVNNWRYQCSFFGIQDVREAYLKGREHQKKEDKKIIDKLKKDKK
jgi:hypothetical protein